MKVLVHICCAPCYGHARKSLEDEGHQVEGLFYNPNIHPYTEYKKRLHALERYAYLTGAKVHFIDEYDVAGWLRGAIHEMKTGGKRCNYCYELRLDRVARFAAENGFDGFTTTLLASTHQDPERIREIAEKAGNEAGVGLLYRDFRKGKKEARQISRDLDLYRQGYCGCIFSEEERYKEDG